MKSITRSENQLATRLRVEREGSRAFSQSSEFLKRVER
jgi:hypothetical protein